MLDKNAKRRRGELPDRIKELIEPMGTRHRAIFRKTYKYWVRRKDVYFGDCDWPLAIEVYKNVRGALIVRAKVLALGDKPSPNTPLEWIVEKPIAPIILHPQMNPTIFSLHQK